MARIRAIKPEFFTSEDIAELTRDARLLFVGMWCWCDDGGVHPVGARALKMQVFPGDDDITVQQVADMIGQLLDRGLLHEYEVGGRRYWLVTGWEKHQYIEKPRFQYPRPDGNIPTRCVPVRVAKQEVTAPLPLPEEQPVNTVTPVTLMEPEEPKPPKRAKKKTPLADNPVTPEFLEFWEKCPRTNCARGEAWVSYQRAVNNGAKHEEIIYGLAEYNRFLDATGTFAAHATTWLNNKRWGLDYNAAIATHEMQNGRRNKPSSHDKLGAAWASAVAEASDQQD